MGADRSAPFVLRVDLFVAAIKMKTEERTVEPNNILQTLSLEQKAALCVGSNFWMTKAIPEACVPALFLCDGPHGLRKQEVEHSDHLGLNESEVSVCWPTGSAAACCWDRELLFFMGDMLGREAARQGVDMLLGPAINIKRSPLCGRNFEYYSEDPFLAGELAAAFVRGVQANRVAACPKHFAANNQETRRKAVDAVVDERTLREIYLAPFEAAVRGGGAWAVMSAYNKVNGDYPAQNPHLAGEILRGEWGFDGALVTDWGAMDQIVPSIRAGLSLQMPGNDGSSAEKLVRAVRAGELEEAALDRAAGEVLRLAARTRRGALRPVSAEDCHAGAARVALGSMVLLKNQGDLLPLAPGMRLAVVGQMAAEPRYQGAGSSHVNPYRLTSPLEEMRKDWPDLVYVPGYEGETMSGQGLAEARRAAAEAEATVLFVGLPASYEAETYDRQSIELPPAHDQLVRELARAAQNLVVVLCNGGAVRLPWRRAPRAILEAYLGGEAAGEAVAALLAGRAAPSGKLAETFPERLEHTPAHLSWPGEGDRAEYREGVFVGYRYYEKKKLPVAYPFGHGLSYTRFAYSGLELSAAQVAEGGRLAVRCRVKNVGGRAGAEVVQLYVRNPAGPRSRPEKELRGFEKLYLEPGQEATVEFCLERRAFSYYEPDLGDWYAPAGEYGILVGASSADIRLRATVRCTTARRPRRPIGRNTLLGDILARPELERAMLPTYEAIRPCLPFGLDKLDLSADRLARSLLENMTLNSLASYVGRRLDDEALEGLIARLNAAQAEN